MLQSKRSVYTLMKEISLIIINATLCDDEESRAIFLRAQIEGKI